MEGVIRTLKKECKIKIKKESKTDYFRWYLCANHSLELKQLPVLFTISFCFMNWECFHFMGVFGFTFEGLMRFNWVLFSCSVTLGVLSVKHWSTEEYTTSNVILQNKTLLIQHLRLSNDVVFYRVNWTLEEN